MAKFTSRARVASSRRVEAMLFGEELARAVLKAKDRYELLSLGSAVPVVLTADGFLNLEDEEVRKCYTKIAARIHPDKLPGCSDATKAFQALVRAYELCCKPELRADDSDDSRDDDEEDDDDDDEGGLGGAGGAALATGGAAAGAARAAAVEKAQAREQLAIGGARREVRMVDDTRP